MPIPIPCDCMVTEQSDGSSRCNQCRGDWYGCECPVQHSIRCSEHPENIEIKQDRWDEASDEF